MRMPWDSQLKVDRQPGKYIRERSGDLYHTARWTKLSKAWRESHPLCEECRKAGVVKPAEVTDHIIPWPVCGADGFFDRNNLQSLCQDCNHLKGQRDKARIAAWRRDNVNRQG